MENSWFQDAVEHLLTQIEKEGLVNGNDFIREYFSDSIVNGLEELDEDSLEAYILDVSPEFNDYVQRRKIPLLVVDAGFNCRYQTYQEAEAVTIQGAGHKVNESFLSKYYRDLNPTSALSLEGECNSLIHDKNYDESYAGVVTLFDYYYKVADNSFKSVEWIKKKIDISEKLDKISTYKAFEEYGDILNKAYKKREAAKAYEDAYNELQKRTPQKILNYWEKKIEFLSKARMQYASAGDNKNTSRLFVIECEEERKKTGSIMMLIYKLLSNYGESPWFVMAWIFFIIIAFALFYSVFGINIPVDYRLDCEVNFGELSNGYCDDNSKASFLTYWYFSTVTFTTLGYGDFSPLEGWSRFLASLQAMLGLTLSSLFIVTFVRKFGR